MRRLIIAALLCCLVVPAWAVIISLLPVVVGTVDHNSLVTLDIPDVTSTTGYTTKQTTVSALLSLTGSTIRRVTTGSSDTATSSDGIVAVALASPAAFTETLPQCASGNQGQKITVKDELGQAASYAITVKAAGSPTASTVDTIPGATGFSIVFSYSSIDFRCDSSISGGNWMAG